MDFLRPNVIEINGRRYRRLIWPSSQADEPVGNKVEEKFDLGRFVLIDCKLLNCFSFSSAIFS